MEFYTHFHQRGGKVYLRCIENGVRTTKTISNFKPTLYIPSNTDSEFKNLHGMPLKQMRFDGIPEAKDFVKTYADVSGMNVYGNCYWGHAAINERYIGDVAYDETQILAYYLDIETEVGDCFPDPMEALQRINVLTIFDGTAFRVWAFKDSKPTMEHPGEVYRRTFDDEELMLQDFIRYWHVNCPDVLTGWNIKGFDVPYLINRIMRLFGKDHVKMLSPVSRVYESPSKANFGKTDYDIIGVEIIDYMELFKNFMPGERESFKLDDVAYDILGGNKLENPYSTFPEFYTNAWDTFVDYNIHDVSLVFQLEQKLKLLSLAYSIAYLVKMNFSEVFGTVKPWDIFIQNELSKVKTFVDADVSPGVSDRKIAGGFVMDPKVGRFKWVVSFDANSLYPSIIRTWNISPETLVRAEDVPAKLLPWYDRIQIDELLNPTPELTELLHIYNFTMTANGQFYRRDFQGVMPKLCEYVYNMRKAAQKELKAKKKQLQDLPEGSDSSALQASITALDNKQWALKILINSLYGAMANEYFRHFDFRNAEGITTTGQYFIRYVAKHGSAFLDKLTGGDDSLVYIDTDSNYFTLEAMVQKAGLMGADNHKVVDVIDKFCTARIDPKIKTLCAEICEQLNVFDPQLAVKREKICSAAVWVAKKRYALYVYDNEGFRYDEPVVSVIGLETKRSSTPKVCREAIGVGLKIVLGGTEQELQTFVKKTHGEFITLNPAIIAKPTGVKNLAKYSDSATIYASDRCPKHVRATLLYNHHLRKNKLLGRYNEILEGGKMRHINLKMPNPIHDDVIGFIDRLPTEFGLDEYIDYEDMFERTFLKPLEKIANACSWNCYEVITLEAFMV